MKRLAVMAHYDPRGQVGPHVRRQVHALATSVSDLVIVTTADLEAGARRFLSEHGRLVERRNFGYDFYSYKVGLGSAGDLTAYDEVTICNDSYVGPLMPYRDVFDQMASRPVDFWGMTVSERISHHVQSFFVTVRPWVVASRAFREFWNDMTPLPNRSQIIMRYEVGLTRSLRAAGFACGSYFTESASDERLARRRMRWAALHHRSLPRTRVQAQHFLDTTDSWNPAAGLADMALDAARLPLVKIDTLRYDPYHLGAGDLLTMCEQRFPTEFDGVRSYLAATETFYPRRPGELKQRTPRLLRPARPLVAYRSA